MTDKSPRLMLESEIPSFVEEVIKTGCNICAIGHDIYVIGDAAIPPKDNDNVAIQLERIREKYGDPDFLRLEIVAYLRSRGRYLDDSSVDHWSKNPQPN